jgi:hypothetical protein
MDTVPVQKARELPESVLSAVELILGRSVKPDEEVTIAAAPPQQITQSGTFRKLKSTKRLQKL